jgi:hypothetical protein
MGVVMLLEQRPQHHSTMVEEDGWFDPDALPTKRHLSALPCGHFVPELQCAGYF